MPRIFHLSTWLVYIANKNYMIDYNNIFWIQTKSNHKVANPNIIKTNDFKPEAENYVYICSFTIFVSSLFIQI